MFGDAVRDVLKHTQAVHAHRRGIFEFAPVLKHSVVAHGGAVCVEVNTVVDAIPIVAFRNVEDGLHVEGRELGVTRKRMRRNEKRERDQRG